MSTNLKVKEKQPVSPWKAALSATLTIVFLGMVVLVALVALTPAGQTVSQFVKWLFAANSVQLWWYVTRSAGIMAYLMLWFSMILGLAVTSKYMDIMLERMFTYDFHQFISLLSIAFLLVHILVLLLDRYMPYSVLQILVPFISPYRPFWVGIGVISFYVIVLVTVTFYIKRRLGMKSFRVIHYLSLAGFLGGLLHGIYSGTDTALPAMQILYKVSGLSVLFFTIYWLVLLALRKAEAGRHTTSVPAQVGRR